MHLVDGPVPRSNSSRFVQIQRHATSSQSRTTTGSASGGYRTRIASTILHPLHSILRDRDRVRRATGGWTAAPVSCRRWGGCAAGIELLVTQLPADDLLGCRGEVTRRPDDAAEAVIAALFARPVDGGRPQDRIGGSRLLGQRASGQSRRAQRYTPSAVVTRTCGPDHRLECSGVHESLEAEPARRERALVTRAGRRSSRRANGDAARSLIYATVAFSGR